MSANWNSRSRYLLMIKVGIVLAVPALFRPADAADSQSVESALEEIVVTARKREEGLQETPISVSAFSASDLEFRQVDSADRLDDFVPNLTFKGASPVSGSGNAAQIFIRGVGQQDFTPVTDPGVGLYIDGVYIARSLGSVLDFLEIDRIEVLRGPQGTLFGRNTIGGAISIHAKRPTDDFAASVAAQVGSDDMRFLTARLNGAIHDNLNGSIAYSLRKRDGYVIRGFDGLDLGDDDSHSARAALLWEPTEAFQAYLTADVTVIRENGNPTINGGPNELGAFATFGNGLLDSCTAVSINPAFPQAGPPSFPPPGVPASADGCVSSTRPDPKGESGGTYPVKDHLDIWGTSLELSWDVNEWLSLKSITAVRSLETETSRDGDNSAANIFQSGNQIEQDQFSQEFQVSGDFPVNGKALNWLAGAYYFEEDGVDVNPVILPVGNILSGGLFDNDSRAIFAQGTYELTEKLSITAGVRYTKDTKRFTPDTYAFGDSSQLGHLGSTPFAPTWPLLEGIYFSAAGPLPAGARLLPFTEFKEEFDDTNFMANLSYAWSDDFMTYLTYSEGFKSGGFDQRFAAPRENNAPSSFRPETVKSYEFGIKSEWLDRTLRLNASFFYTDYRDLQLVIRENFNSITFNGGTADISGSELEIAWIPAPQWTISATFGWIDAEYDELSEEVITNASPIFPNNKLVNTPDKSATLGIAYRVTGLEWGLLTPRLDWSYHDGQYNDAINSPQLYQESYHLLNAGVMLESTDGRWEAFLGARNLLDEEFLVSGASAFNTPASYLELVYDRGFEWSASFRLNFF